MAKLPKVLFVRVDDELKNAIERRLRAARKQRKGVTISEADVVRELLWIALRSESK